jgi:hypothetical protein
LRVLDRSHKVFGARSHQYLSTPASEAEIAWLERELASTLPDEYRRFLLSVGYGAGPYYGLWSPRQAVAEISGICGEFAAEQGIRVRPCDPFPLTDQDLRLVEEKIRLEDEKPFAERSWPSSGCLPICHHGCTFWSALVLQGQFAGRIWDVASYVAYEGLWVPASRPPGWWEFGMPRPQALPPLPSPPTFLEWFSGWLERCFADLRA